ncbi:MAG: hypothetical protein NZ879_07580 [Archaeoglobaceae archaeon]|nr:hypothetical protein [Archaeoglobaceae archaeon]MDW8118826.1 hypothetical protein [Archaeoglobaceae archaeon]
MVAFTLLGFLLVGWTLNDCSFYGFWITLLATFLIFLPIIPEKVKLSEKITNKRAELPKPETTKRERKRIKRPLSSLDFAVFKLISEDANNIEKIQEKIPSVAMQSIQSSIELLLEKGYIVLENGKYKLTTHGYENLKNMSMGEKQRENEIKKRAVEMTLISKSLNTMALFIFAISFLFPLASLGNTGGMQYILLMSSVKIRPSHDLGFYLLILAPLIWLISYFTNKLENKLADQIICR